jgi:hypothetical protein
MEAKWAWANLSVAQNILPEKVAKVLTVAAMG